MLYDPVRAVRIEAAAKLAGVPESAMAPDIRRVYQTALAEYRRAMQRTADFAPSRHNLGNLNVSLGQINVAEQHYRTAIAIDRGGATRPRSIWPCGLQPPGAKPCCGRAAA
jgi:hypothetical protein